MGGCALLGQHLWDIHNKTPAKAASGSTPRQTGEAYGGEQGGSRPSNQLTVQLGWQLGQ